MARGIATRRALRPRLRAVSRADAVRFPARPPLPSVAVEYWHSEFGASAANAVGQIAAITLPGQNTPVVAPDPGFFKGRNVYQSSAASAYGWRGTGLATVLASGTRPWVFCVGRFTNPAPGTVQNMYFVARAATSDCFCLRQVVAGQLRGVLETGLQIDSTVPWDNRVHRFKLWKDGTNRNIQCDDVVTSSADAGTLAQNVDTVSLGYARDAATGHDSSLAFLLLCSAKPSAAEESALDAWARGYWGSY